MKLQIKSGLRRLWRDAGTLQIGLSQRRGTVVAGLTTADVPLLEQLRDGLDIGVLEADGDGPAAERRRELIGLLSEAGVLVGTGSGRTARDALGTAAERLVPDAAIWSVVHPDAGDGWDLLAARAACRVVISGAGRLGSTLAATLAAAGVGEVTVGDQRRVTAADLAPGGAGRLDLGRPREEAALDAVRRFGSRAERAGTLPGRADTRAAAARAAPPQTASARPGQRDTAEQPATTNPAGVAGEPARRPRPDRRASGENPRQPDLVVLIEHGAADAAAAGRLISIDQPHLSVVVREDDVLVGPLVRPGSGPCLRCLDLHRGDRDPAWPSVLAQLLGPATGTPDPEETATSTLAAGLVALQVLAHLDGVAEPATAEATLEIELPDGLIARRSWPAHPRCGCHWPPDPAGSEPDRPTTGHRPATDGDSVGSSADQGADRSLPGAHIRQLTRTMGS